jgi:hypothetical protein
MALRSITFIAMLFCMGLSGLFVGGLNLYERAEFHFKGKAATMRLADPGRKITLPAPGGGDIYQLDVKYTGSGGEIVVPQKRFTRERAQKLVNGEGLPITYLSHDPKRVLYPGESLDSPWGWLIVGAAAMGTFAYALKLKRGEGNA